MTGLERAGTGGKQLLSKAFSTQATGFFRTCTQKAHKQRDSTDFFTTSPPPARASTVSTMSGQRTGTTAGRDTSQHQPARQTTHLWTLGATSRRLGLKMQEGERSQRTEEREAVIAPHKGGLCLQGRAFTASQRT